MSILILSTIIGITCTSWLTIWIILEINVLAMCNILSSSSNTINKSESATFMYYLIQVLLSIIIVSWVMYHNNESNVVNLIVCIAILSNVGMWPLHGWYVNLITTIEINQNAIIVIITWQNVLPVILIIALQITETLLIAALVIIGGTIIASLSQLNQNIEINNIIAISSINNNSWILISALVSLQCFFIFLSLYSTTLILTLNIIENIIENSNHIVNNFWINTLLVSNISGLPPLALFWGNITVVNIIMNSEIPTETALILILSACLLIYHYLWVTLSETSHSPENSQINLNTNNESNALIIVTLLSLTGAVLFIASGLTN